MLSFKKDTMDFVYYLPIHKPEGKLVIQLLFSKVLLLTFRGRLFALLISNTLLNTLLKSTLFWELWASRKMPFDVFIILFPFIMESAVFIKVIPDRVLPFNIQLNTKPDITTQLDAALKFE